MPNYARALLNESLDFTYFEPYQTEQIKALVLLVKQLQKTYAIPAENVLAHADVAPWRTQNNITVFGKSDPGPTLPWKELAHKDISQSVNEKIECPDEVKQNTTLAKAQDYLRQIGYASIDTDAIETKINLTLGAYRLHFMPECFNRSTNYSTNCYSQPFDEATACNMYRVIQSQNRPTQHRGTLFWPESLIALGGTLFLLALVICSVMRCGSRRNTIEEIHEAEDDYSYAALNNN